MSDEGQQDAPVPESPAPEASSEPPTEGLEAPPAATPPPEAASGAGARRSEEDDVERPAAATTTSTQHRGGFFVPRWLAFVVGGLLAALVFGGIGYAIGDSGGGGSSQNTSAFPGNGRIFPGNGNGFPNPFGNGNGPFGYGNGNGGAARNRVFLGVALEGTNNGVRITQVVPNSPAADAGLKVGDVITKIDNTSVTTPLAAQQTIRSHHAGDKIPVTYTRDGKSATASATLATRTTQS